MSDDTGAAGTAGENGGKARSNPGPMRVLIGNWCESCGEGSKKTFEVLAEAKSAGKKDVRDAIKALGYGKYTVLVGRFSGYEYKQVTRDAFG